MTERQRALCHTWQTARAGYTVQFVWFGGPFVEIYVNRRATEHVLNVWDYAAGKAQVGYSGAGLRHAATAWLKDNEDVLGTV